MKGEVLFFDFAFEDFLPVIEEAAARGLRPLMNQPPMRQRLSERGVHAQGFETFAVQEDSDYARRGARALRERFARGLSAPGAAQAFATDGSNLLLSGSRDLVEQILALAENQLLISRVMHRLVASTDLKAVVMRSCMSAGQRVVQEVAMKHGVPVLELSHGNPSRDLEFSGPVGSWHKAVFGSRERDVLAARGTDSTLLHLTGAAQWDGLYQPGCRPSKEEARQNLGIPLDRPFILLTGSFSSGRTLYFADTSLFLMEAMETFVGAVAQLPGAPLVAIRPHPGEWRQGAMRSPNQAELTEYRQWFTERGVNLIHVDYDTSSLIREKTALIRAADVVVVQSTSSTIATEALILDRPVVVFSNPPLVESFYTEADGVGTAESIPQLADLLDRLLGDPAHQEAVRAAAREALPHLNHGNDGRAGIRIVDLIETLT